MTIRLKKATCYRFTGRMKYLASYDYAAGRRNRYELVILTDRNPVVIGREIPLPLVRELIAEYESVASTMHDFMGSWFDVSWIAQTVSECRRTQSE